MSIFLPDRIASDDYVPLALFSSFLRIQEFGYKSPNTSKALGLMDQSTNPGLPPIIIGPAAESAPCQPPPIPESLDPKKREVWGFWATLGLGVVIGLCMVGAQM